MSTTPLPLSIICATTVTATPQGAVTPQFNVGLITGPSGRIPIFGANARLRNYANVAAMIADGFQENDPEVIEAGLYFGVGTNVPQSVWVGSEEPTAIRTLNIHAGATPTLWAVGDQFSITQGPAAGGIGEVTAEAEGVPSAIEIISQGHGYSVANSLATVALNGGTGIGLTVDITAIGETPAQALAACRAAQPAFYTASSTDATDTDHLACAQFAQSATPPMQYVYGTQSASAASGATGNIFSLIKAQLLMRAHGAYSTTQGGLFPNNAYIAGAIQGRAMGLNTGLAASQFTLDAKTLPGVSVEPLSLTQVGVIAGLPQSGLTGNNGNVYVNIQNSYNFYLQGVNGDGTWFDQVLGLDMLAADAAISVVNVLASLASIPQDDAGQSLCLNAALGACARAATRGFLATGVWDGQTVLNVSAGTPLPLGYLAQSPSFLTQSPADKKARKGMPIFLTVILAGAQQSFTIGINVQE